MTDRHPRGSRPIPLAPARGRLGAVISIPPVPWWSCFVALFVIAYGFPWLPDGVRSALGSWPVAALLPAALVLLLLPVVRLLRLGPMIRMSDVSAGPNEPLRAPVAEARLRMNGWTQLAVFRMEAAGMSQRHVDTVRWVSPAGDAVAETCVFPSGEHLSIFTVFEDGDHAFTSWEEPVLDQWAHCNGSHKKTCGRDQDLFALHAARIVGRHPTRHDRPRVLGWERIHAKAYARMYHWMAVVLQAPWVLGLLAVACAARFYDGGTTVLMAVLALVAAIAAQFVLLDDGFVDRLVRRAHSATPGELRATDACPHDPPPLPPVTEASPSPWGPPAA